MQEVRPYALTGGRTAPRNPLRLVTALSAASEPPPDSNPETELVLSLCRGRALSVAEFAAHLRQPVLVTKILLSDLLDAGALVLVAPREITDPKDPALLEAILAGLQTL